MGLRDILHETWISLLTNKVRSFLTILGIIIGISSVIAMTSLVGSMKETIWSELGLYQGRMVQVFSTISLYQADIDALEQAFPELESTATVAYADCSVSSAEHSVQNIITGVTANYSLIFNVTIEQGRDISEQDAQTGARVLILGRGIVRDLFGSEDAMAVGQQVRVGPNNETYNIIGVMEGNATSSEYTGILMPLTTMQGRITGNLAVDNISALATDGTDVTALAAEVQEFFDERYSSANSDSAVTVFAMEDMLDTIDTFLSSFSIMMAAIASISLFVGGIGIMNMMLTAVTERTREIGLRKSLGARTGDITRQFLSESVALCLVGGLLGILTGYLGTFVLSAAINAVQTQFQLLPVIDPVSVVISVAVCAAIGIVFGLYPARRAARLDPVEALSN